MQFLVIDNLVSRDLRYDHSRHKSRGRTRAMGDFAARKITLERPDVRYKASYLAGLEELGIDAEKSAWVYLGDNEPLDTPAKDFETYVARLRSTEIQALPHFVKTTCYWAIYNDEMIGRIAIRHDLNDFLRTIGGHIGYIVRPSFRRMGVATEMLRQILRTDQAKSIQKILITCDENNLASERTIIKNGGIFESVIPNGDKARKKRFWIDLSIHRSG